MHIHIKKKIWHLKVQKDTKNKMENNVIFLSIYVIFNIIYVTYIIYVCNIYVILNIFYSLIEISVPDV